MKRGLNSLIVAAVGGIVLGAAAMGFAFHETSGERVKVILAEDIQEKLNGEDSKVTVVQVTIEPGEGGVPHRHPGPGFVYVAEGEYELGIDQQPVRRLHAGEAFYEPGGCLHRVSRNPSKEHRTRLIAFVVHPRSAEEIAIPEQH